ncbi:MAG TPA: response regulator [Xanthobacteraceae bacterium]|jgi:two-component system chemotaxis response regulator CheY
MPVDLSKPVLVVEDSQTMGQIVRNLLMLMGFKQVDAVADVATALTRLRSKPYRLVISDWNMQPATGQVLLERIRHDPFLSELPVIVVSAESHIETIRAATNAGASGYVVKPFSGETLKQKIAAVLHGEVLV